MTQPPQHPLVSLKQLEEQFNKRIDSDVSQMITNYETIIRLSEVRVRIRKYLIARVTEVVRNKCIGRAK